MYSREEINYKCSICVTLLLYVNNTSRNRVKADIHRKVWTSCNVCICCASGTKIGLMKNIGEPYIQKRIYRGLQKLLNSFSRASYGPDNLPMPFMENNSLLFSSHHLEFIISENSWFFACYFDKKNIDKKKTTSACKHDQSLI